LDGRTASTDLTERLVPRSGGSCPTNMKASRGKGAKEEGSATGSQVKLKAKRA